MSRGFQIAPWGALRVAGMPADALVGLRLRESPAVERELAVAEIELAAARADAAARMFDVVRGCEDEALRRAALEAAAAVQREGRGGRRARGREDRAAGRGARRARARRRARGPVRRAGGALRGDVRRGVARRVGAFPADARELAPARGSCSRAPTTVQRRRSSRRSRAARRSPRRSRSARPRSRVTSSAPRRGRRRSREFAGVALLDLSASPPGVGDAPHAPRTPHVPAEARWRGLRSSRSRTPGSSSRARCLLNRRPWAPWQEKSRKGFFALHGHQAVILLGQSGDDPHLFFVAHRVQAHAEEGLRVVGAGAANAVEPRVDRARGGKAEAGLLGSLRAWAWPSMSEMPMRSSRPFSPRNQKVPSGSRWMWLLPSRSERRVSRFSVFI